MQSSGVSVTYRSHTYPPSAVTNLSIVESKNSRALINWSPPAESEETILQYQVCLITILILLGNVVNWKKRRSIDFLLTRTFNVFQVRWSLVSRSALFNTTATLFVNSTSVTLSGLEPMSLYYVTVRAFNSAGTTRNRLFFLAYACGFFESRLLISTYSSLIAISFELIKTF